MMALTLEVLQRLEKVGLTALYEDRKTVWGAMAQEAYTYVKKGFGGAQVRPDDVAKVLQPTMAIDVKLSAFLSKKKLRQKYWVKDFTDLVLDRAWAGLK